MMDLSRMTPREHVARASVLATLADDCYTPEGAPKVPYVVTPAGTALALAQVHLEIARLKMEDPTL